MGQIEQKINELKVQFPTIWKYLRPTIVEHIKEIVRHELEILTDA